MLPILVLSAIAVGVAGQSTPCEALQPTAPDGATLVSSTATPAQGYCTVDTRLTHGSAGDNVRIVTWLPTSNWNGRFQGIGGGGMVAGNLTPVPGAVQQGWAAGATDAGLPVSPDGSAWANNTQLRTNFAHLSIHEMTVVGKALAAQFYGSPVKYSYWNGCSTGGRQGHMEAQRYPLDYNGIYAASPAINWDRFHVAMIWPYIVQNTEGEFVPTCVFDSLTAAAIKACSGPDGLIQDPNKCDFDASSVIGTPASCGTNITARQAKIFNKIMVGPVDGTGRRMWSGIVAGAPYSSLAGSQPFMLSSSWIRNFVLQQPSFDLKSLTYSSFVDIFNKSHAMFNDLIGTDNPDLLPFKNAGGKLLSWHGWADQLIFANGTLDYRTRVEARMGGTAAVDEFYRLWMVPGVQHCSGGSGAVPSDPLGALVNWVEKGEAPDTLAGAGPGIQRSLCRYPMTTKYKGYGDVKAAASWICV